MRVMIYIFIGDNLIGWANCIGNPESLLNALACGLIPHLGKYPALWRPSLHTHIPMLLPLFHAAFGQFALLSHV